MRGGRAVLWWVARAPPDTRADAAPAHLLNRPPLLSSSPAQAHDMVDVAPPAAGPAGVSPRGVKAVAPVRECGGFLVGAPWRGPRTAGTRSAAAQ